MSGMRVTAQLCVNQETTSCSMGLPALSAGWVCLCDINLTTNVAQKQCAQILRDSCHNVQEEVWVQLCALRVTKPISSMPHIKYFPN